MLQHPETGLFFFFFSCREDVEDLLLNRKQTEMGNQEPGSPTGKEVTALKM